MLGKLRRGAEASRVEADARSALAALGSPAPAADSSPLTAREREVLQLVAAGLSNDTIAGQLVVSVRTVERHVENIYH